MVPCNTNITLLTYRPSPMTTEAESVLTPGAVDFLTDLERRFGVRRRQLLIDREKVQEKLDQGWRPDFLEATREIREADWTVAAVPKALQKRHVEITGPVDRKMVINALNCDADLFMADFEDSTSPTWENMLQGQINLRDAIRREIDFTHPDTGKAYALGENPAVLLVRPRGWHLEEKHFLVDGEPMSGSLFDFGLYFFHNAHALVENDRGPWFYLPKLENHQEAKLWNDVFLAAQEALELPVGTIKATVLIETILAAFEMDEILWELKDHSAGLNCGRWDYIFSFIKKLRADPACVLPDRGLVGMDQHFLLSYSQLVIRTCHRRGAHAMGGMAAQIPIKGDSQANDAAMDKVHADKKREAENGHDGTWVAHPALVAIAREEFEAVFTSDHQFHVLRDDVQVSAEDLLSVPAGAITETCLRQNLNIGTLYLEAWLRGVGCVPLYNLMEDAATAEISRAQVWQWRRHRATLQDGRTVDSELITEIMEEELASIRDQFKQHERPTDALHTAADLLLNLVLNEEFEDFLTLPAYQKLSPPQTHAS
ncbi:MAG: malate synthase A [Planctomycetota bacterium]|nr:MAG: malate synthase A [Planctomycetota bacterium]